MSLRPYGIRQRSEIGEDEYENSREKTGQKRATATLSSGALLDLAPPTRFRFSGCSVAVCCTSFRELRSVAVARSRARIVSFELAGRSAVECSSCSATCGANRQLCFVVIVLAIEIRNELFQLLLRRRRVNRGMLPDASLCRGAGFARVKDFLPLNARA